MLKKALPVGVENFEDLVKSEYYYVDKTLLIKEFLDKKSFVSLFTRPRRFGKSMALEMLAAYYGRGCDSRELFRGLKIASDPMFEEYLNKLNKKLKDQGIDRVIEEMQTQLNAWLAEK